MLYSICICSSLALAASAHIYLVWRQQRSQTMARCAHCELDLPAWFVSDVSYATNSSVSSLSLCRHCELAEEYPLPDETKKDYDKRLRSKAGSQR